MKLAISGWILAGLLCVAADASAEEAAAPVALSLPAQPLRDALNSFASQTGLQVLYTASEVNAGLAAPRVEGRYTATEALEALLKGSGLKYEFLNPQTVAVVAEGVRKPIAGRGSEGAGYRVAQGDGGSSDSTAPATGSTQASDTKLEEVVVTAQKRQERLQEVPISISVLSGADLDRTNFSVDEALNKIPGVLVQPPGYLGGYTNVAVRGVQSSGLGQGSSPVAYYIDSVPFGLIKSGIAPDMSAYDLRQVEVLRGPQGSLYGASALNGVVRVLTNDADLNSYEFKARASDSGTQGGGNNFRGDAAVNIPIVDGKLAARAVLGYERDSGWVDSPAKDDINDARLGNYRLKINAQPTEQLTIALSSWASRSNFGAPSASDPTNHVSTTEDESIHARFDAYGVKVGYRLHSFSVASSTSYISFKSQSFLDASQIFGYPTGNYIPPFADRDRSDVFAQEVNLTSNIEGPWRWTAGGMYRRGTEKGRQYVVDLFAGEIDVLSKSYAVFGELTRQFQGGHWELTAGLRRFHDDISQLGGGIDPTTFVPQVALTPAKSAASATTPRVVLAWHPSVDLMVYGSYGEGFRSGFPQNFYVPAGFLPLQPDKLKNYEVGAKGSWLDGQISYDSAVYYMKWLETQQGLGVPVNGTYAVALVNANSASGSGVDLSLLFKPFRSFTLGLNGSWNNLAIDQDVISSGHPILYKGRRLASSAETTVGAWAEYSLPLGASGYKGGFSVSANYVSPLAAYNLDTNDNIIETEGERMMLTRASFAVESPNNWTVSVYADNVTNSRGALQLFPWPDFGMQTRPRTIGLQFEYRNNHLR